MVFYVSIDENIYKTVNIHLRVKYLKYSKEIKISIMIVLKFLI